MPLSDYEQSVIDDLERSLLRDDPKLVGAFKSSKPQPYRRIITVAVGVMLGMALLIIGSLVGNSLVVAVGFGAVFLSLAWAVSSKRVASSGGETKDVDYVSLQPKEFAASNSSEPAGKFMGRLEDRWNRRQSELG